MISQIKQIPIVDIAENLLRLNKGLGTAKNGKDILFHGPHGNENTPSLSLSPSKNIFHDFSTGESGDQINLVAYVNRVDVGEAVRIIATHYNIQAEKKSFQKQEKTLVDYIAQKALQNARNEAISQPFLDYLTQKRKIDLGVIKHGIQKAVLGFSDYTAPAKSPGQAGYGGNSLVFIVKNQHKTIAVDMRYLIPKDNGGIKTQCQGDKQGLYWTIDPYKLRSAKVVYVVESVINALSIESCHLPYAAAIATLGTTNIDYINWQQFAGKQIIIAFDKDRPGNQGKFPGQEAGWKLYELLSNQGLISLLLDQDKWHHKGIVDDHIDAYIKENEKRRIEYTKLLEDEEAKAQYRSKIRNILTNYGVDINDILLWHGKKSLKTALENRQRGLIQGVYYKKGVLAQRLHLPFIDYKAYKKYRVHPEHTIFQKEVKSKDKDTGDEITDIVDMDVCGFRIAGMKKVKVVSYSSASTGMPDNMTTDIYAAQVQSRTSPTELIEKVLATGIHDLKAWEKNFGAVLNANFFKRALTILESTAQANTIRVANIVGLAWLDGKLVANDKNSTFFVDANKQCGAYGNLVFNAGNRQDCAKILEKYKDLYNNNSALIMLTWTLCSHFKLFTGFYPHLMIGADKGSGKSTIIEMIGKTCPLKKFAINEMNPYRLRVISSGSSFPVALDEFSNASPAKRIEVVSHMQNTYTKNETVAGADALQYLTFSPALIGSEDIGGLDNVLSKTVKVTFPMKARGRLFDAAAVPQWPLKEWMEYLAHISRDQFKQAYKEAAQFCQSKSSTSDATSERMLKNYTLLLLAWRYVADFAGIMREAWGVEESIIREMNGHIASTDADREPWVKVIEKLLTDIDAGKYPHKHTIDEFAEGENDHKHQCFVIKLSEVMDYFNNTPDLREFRQSLPITSKNALKIQLHNKEMLLRKGNGEPRIVHPYIGEGDGRKRVHNFVAMPAYKLLNYGLTVPGVDYEADAYLNRIYEE